MSPQTCRVVRFRGVGGLRVVPNETSHPTVGVTPFFAKKRYTLPVELPTRGTATGRVEQFFASFACFGTYGIEAWSLVAPNERRRSPVSGGRY